MKLNKNMSFLLMGLLTVGAVATSNAEAYAETNESAGSTNNITSSSNNESYFIQDEDYTLIDTVIVETPWEEAISDYAVDNNITYQEAEKILLPKSRVDGTAVLTQTNTYSIASGYKVSVRVRFVRTSYGSFHQYDEVLSVTSYPDTGNHTWNELEVYDYNTSYPSTNLNIEVFGYSEIAWNEQVSGGFDVPGFSASYSVGTTTYYRKEQALRFRL